VFCSPDNPQDPGAAADNYAFDTYGATTPNIDPDLVRFCPVPFGATVCFWLPYIEGAQTSQDNDPADPNPPVYLWQIVHRFRNTGDYRRDRRPYHIKKQTPGAPDGLDPRLVIPAAVDTVSYSTSEPIFSVEGPSGQFSTKSLYPEVHAIRGQELMPVGLPVGPNGDFGPIGQGIISPVSDTEIRPYIPHFFPVWSKCAGDEIAVFCYKYKTRKPGEANPIPDRWDFATDGSPDNPLVDPDSGDWTFSVLLGMGPWNADGLVVPNLDMGVYMSIGTAGA
jgi:hypothetical protein